MFLEREEEYHCQWKLWARRAMHVVQWDYVEGGSGVLCPFDLSLRTSSKVPSLLFPNRWHHHLPAPSSAFICLSWLFLTHTNSRADIINATLSVLFYLYNQTQDCQFYTTINVSLILAISAWSLRKKMWGLFNVIFLWGFIKTLLTEMRVQGLHLAIKQGLNLSNWVVQLLLTKCRK